MVAMPTEVRLPPVQSRPALRLARGLHVDHVHFGGQLVHEGVAGCIRLHIVQPHLGQHHCDEEFHALPP